MIKLLITKYFTGHERTVKARKNIAGSIIVKGANIALGFIMVPLTIHYLNPEKYGMWLTLSSIINWFYFFDIGLGNGLRNRIGEAMAKGETELARIYLSSTYALLTIIASLLLISFMIINPFLNWSKILNASLAYKHELSLLALFVFSSFTIQFVLKLFKMVLLADQRSALGNFLDLTGKIISLLIIIFLIHHTQNSLLYLGISLSFVPVIVLGFATFIFFKSRYKSLQPSIKLVKFSSLNSIMNLGLKFFFIQIASLVLYATDNIIISQLYGPQEVTPYNIAYKYFTIITMGFSIMVDPFWGAFTEAWTKKDITWIKRTISQLNKLFIIFLTIDAFMVVFAGVVYKIWIGRDLHISFILTLTMGFYVALVMLSNIYVYFINGVGKIKLQFYTSFASTILNIPLAIFFAKYLELGLSGIILANCICILYGPVIAPIQYHKLINNKAKGIWNK
jgi:O-antigen/teichoic acid export membrane protein